MSDPIRTDDQTLRRRAQWRFVFVAAGVLLVGVVGYTGFLALARSDRPAGSGVLALGALTGFASFFSPCSFPLLLTFLARRGEESTRSAVATALRVGAGAASMLAILGLAIAVGGAALGRIVEFDEPIGRVFRIVVGMVLLAFGLKQARLVRFEIKWMTSSASRAGQMLAHSQSTSRARKDFLYGFGFLLAGFG